MAFVPCFLDLLSKQHLDELLRPPVTCRPPAENLPAASPPACSGTHLSPDLAHVPPGCHHTLQPGQAGEGQSLGPSPPKPPGRENPAGPTQGSSSGKPLRRGPHQSVRGPLSASAHGPPPLQAPQRTASQLGPWCPSTEAKKAVSKWPSNSKFLEDKHHVLFLFLCISGFPTDTWAPPLCVSAARLRDQQPSPQALPASLHGEGRQAGWKQEGP